MEILEMVIKVQVIPCITQEEIEDNIETKILVGEVDK